jgi:HAD superfamily hydrolase (TIGR01549 family)
MIKAVLFDLDDTLLGNDIDNFMNYYLALLSQHAKSIMDPQQFLTELLVCTRTMIANTDQSKTNRDVFWETFAQRNDMHDIDELENYFEGFYRDVFPQLKGQTECRESAARLVQYCLDQGLQVVIATNPVFPPIAIEHRMAWAGVAIDDFPFALVTNYSNMHTTKPHPSYYQEILQKIVCQPHEALMVGDNWENDMVPAASLGLSTYWIADDAADLPDTAVSINQQGSLKRLEDLIMSGWLNDL